MRSLLRFEGAAVIAVIFDVGGVLIDWNPRHLYRKLFNEDAAMERFLAEVCTPAWNHRQDAGRSWAEGTAELVARWPEHEALIRAFDARWEEMVPGLLAQTVALVRMLASRGVKLYCLTNFSAEKFPLVRRRFDFFEVFDGIVVSGEVGLAKPDPAIFRHLLNRFALPADGCLFIDDMPANVAAASTVGIAAHLFRSADALAIELRQRGLL
ncbi:MAG: HAD family phosphatase [Rhodospirillales bacterium]|nr:HAD family phosphatase [Rhodospirillales bacterium]